MTKSARINQQALAKNLNLSIATVSRSLQDHPDIAPLTKERVIAEAERLGYQRKIFRTLAPPAASTAIGILIACADRPTVASQLDALYLMGMNAAAQERQVSLISHYYLGGSEQLLGELPAALRPGAVAALVLLHQTSPQVITALARTLPVVTVAHHVPDSPVDHIDADHQAGMSALVGHLAELGHRRIGYALRRSSGIPFTRLGSLVGVVSARRLNLDPALVVELPLDTAVAENRARPTAEVLSAQTATIDDLVARIRQGTTAWVCDSDATAYWLYRLLRERGLRIPEDVSLSGFDGFAPYPDCPQVTTIAVPFVDLGRQAIHRATDVIQGHAGPRIQVHVRGKLLVGATTGKAPATA